MSETTKPKSILDQIDGGEITSTVGNEPVTVEAIVTKPVKVAKSKTAQIAAATPASAVPATAVPIGGKTLEELVAIMLRKEAREAAEEENRLLTQQTKKAQRNRNARDKDSKILLKQARCKHLKGGKAGPKNQQIDYAVAPHVFINSTVYIKCLVCGARWYPEDTVEYLLRKGHKIANHTHKGWTEAIQMTQQSSNTQTKSERVGFTATQTDIDSAAKYLGGNAVPTDIKVVDLEGNPVEGVEL